MEPPIIRRAFVDVPFGQIHYRFAGDGPPLLLCHASPGSARQLEPLIARLARSRRVIAPDTAGFGDSSPLFNAAPTIADFANGQFAFLDALRLDQVDVYGTHTGASIVGEMALLRASTARRVILDGVSIFTAEEREEFMRLYAHPFASDLEGAYLLKAFMFCRDQYLFFPWYARDAAHLRPGGIPSDESLHEWVLEVLKARTTYHLGYRAAFAYLPEVRAPLIQQPTMIVAAQDDPLRGSSRSVADEMPNASYVDLPSYGDPQYLETLAAEIDRFLS